MNTNRFLLSEFANPQTLAPLFQGFVTEDAQAIIDNLVINKYCMSQSSQEAISAIFHGGVRYRPTVNGHPHPELAFSYDYMYKELTKAMDKQKNVVVIGGTYKEVRNYILEESLQDTEFYIIMGIYDSRDWIRITDGRATAIKDFAGNNAKLAKYAHDYLRVIEAIDKLIANNRPYLDVHGDFFYTRVSYRMCNIEADIGICSECLYDIEPLTLMAYGLHFKIPKFVATMIQAPDLIHRVEFVDRLFNVKFRWSGKEFIQMVMPGGELGYTHKAENYFFWCFENYYEPPADYYGMPWAPHIMCFERNVAIGIHTKMNIYINPKLETRLVRVVPSCVRDYCRLWRIFPWLRYRKINFFYTQRDKYEAIYGFACRQQVAEFEPPKILALAHSKRFQITIAGQVLQLDWNADMDIVTETSLFAMVHAIFTRGGFYEILQKALKASKSGGFSRDFLPNAKLGALRSLFDYFWNSPFGQDMNWDNLRIAEKMDSVLRIDTTIIDDHIELLDGTVVGTWKKLISPTPDPHVTTALCIYRSINFPEPVRRPLKSEFDTKKHKEKPSHITDNLSLKDAADQMELGNIPTLVKPLPKKVSFALRVKSAAIPILLKLKDAVIAQALVPLPIDGAPMLDASSYTDVVMDRVETNTPLSMTAETDLPIEQLPTGVVQEVSTPSETTSSDDSDVEETTSSSDVSETSSESEYTTATDHSVAAESSDHLTELEDNIEEMSNQVFLDQILASGIESGLAPDDLIANNQPKPSAPPISQVQSEEEVMHLPIKKVLHKDTELLIQNLPSQVKVEYDGFDHPVMLSWPKAHTPVVLELLMYENGKDSLIQDRSGTGVASIEIAHAIANQKEQLQMFESIYEQTVADSGGESPKASLIPDEYKFKEVEDEEPKPVEQAQKLAPDSRPYVSHCSKAPHTKGSTKHFVKRFQLFAHSYTDFGTQPYKRRSDSGKTCAENGQRKLACVELQWFIALAKDGKIKLHEKHAVFYAGAAPGMHIKLLAKIFPHWVFHLYDPKPFADHLAMRNVILHKEKFNGKTFRVDQVSNQNHLLISDIRGEINKPDGSFVENDQRDQIVLRDMLEQRSWMVTGGFRAGLLKFTLPYASGQTAYLTGKLMLQPFTHNTGTECRLWVDPSDYTKTKMYDHDKYNDMMHNFNLHYRPHHFSDPTPQEGYDCCYDCHYEKLLIRELAVMETKVLDTQNPAFLFREFFHTAPINENLTTKDRKHVIHSRAAPSSVEIANLKLNRLPYQADTRQGQLVSQLEPKFGYITINATNSLQKLTDFMVHKGVSQSVANLGSLSNLEVCLGDCSEKARSACNQLKTLEIQAKVCVWNAYAGSGKTYRAIELFRKTDAMIVPTNAAHGDVYKKIQAKFKDVNWGPNVFTPDKAMSKKNFNKLNCSRRIYIDEVFQFPVGYLIMLMTHLKGKEFVLIGDINQCKFHDPDADAKVYGAIDILNYNPPVQTLNVTYRCGPSVCALIRKLCPDYKIVSATPYDTGIRVIPYNDLVNGKYQSELDRGFNIAASNPTLEKVKSGRTIRTSQGQTYETVNLCWTRNDTALFNNVGEMIVGLSRATRQLNIVEVEPGSFSTFPVNLMPLIDNPIPYVGDSNFVINSLPRSEEIAPEHQRCKDVDFNADLASQFIHVSGVPYETAYFIKSPHKLPDKFVFDPSVFQDYKKFKHLVLTPSAQGAVYRVSSKWQTIVTSLVRLAVTNRLKIFPRDAIPEMLSNFKKMFVNPDYKPINLMDIVAKAQSSVIESQKDKGFPDLKTEMSPSSLDGHLKTIVKIKEENIKLHDGKAGQPIYAWSKWLNVQFGTLFRGIADMLRNGFLKENTIYANGYTPEELNAAMFKAFYGGNADNGIWVEGDMPEYDASQHAETIFAEWEIYKQFFEILFGKNDWNYHLYIITRISAVVYELGCKFSNKEMKTSGEPGTFLWNTILLMAIFARVLKPEWYIAGAFGGDDSALKVRASKEELINRIAELKLNMKFDLPPVTMFFHHFLTSKGMIYDPYRLLLSCLSKNYYQDNYDSILKLISERQIAVADKLKSYTNYNMLFACLKQRYKMNVQHCQQLMTHLEAFTSTSPKKIALQLMPVEVELGPTGPYSK